MSADPMVMVIMIVVVVIIVAMRMIAIAVLGMIVNVVAVVRHRKLRSEMIDLRAMLRIRDQRTGQIQNASPTRAMNAPLNTSP